MKIKKVVFAAVLLLLILTLTACSGQEGKIVSVYQPLVGGTVHTWIEVKLEDGTTVDAILPDNDDVWRQARNSVGKQVRVKEGAERWEFVDFVK